MAIEHTPDEKEPPELGRPHDTHILWRITGWGASAAVALAAAVLISQTDSGAQRLRLAFAPQANAPARSIAQADLAMPSATAKLAETQRLESQRLETQLRALAADRDRLNARIVSLEQNLNDMTGSIKRELALVAAKAPAPIISPPSITPPHTATEAATAGDVKSQPASSETTSQAQFETSIGTKPEAKTAAKTEAKTKDRLEPIVETPGNTAEATPDHHSKTQATLLAGAAVPLPPVRVASAPVSEPVAAAKRKPELGVDLGGAHSMAILHARWIALKANFGPLLEGLHPLVGHDRRPAAIPYRLLVGPLPNGAAAAQVCARFAASHVTCRTTRFVGEALAQQ